MEATIEIPLEPACGRPCLAVNAGVIGAFLLHHTPVVPMIRSILLSALVALSLPLVGGCATSTPPATTAPPADTVSPSDQGDNIVGAWAYIVASPGGGDEGTFTITGESGEYEGEFIVRGQPTPLSDISLDGDALSFSFQVGQTGPIVRCTGVITNDVFEGTSNAGQFGTFPMTATRSSRS